MYQRVFNLVQGLLRRKNVQHVKRKAHIPSIRNVLPSDSGLSILLITGQMGTKHFGDPLTGNTNVTARNTKKSLTNQGMSYISCEILETNILF